MPFQTIWANILLHIPEFLTAHINSCAGTFKNFSPFLISLFPQTYFSYYNTYQLLIKCGHENVISCLCILASFGRFKLIIRLYQKYLVFFSKTTSLMRQWVVLLS